MTRRMLATVWLDGCSGCHMSFLDLDERLLDVAARTEIVYSPLVDRKEYPDGVDVCLVEGAVATDEDLAKIRLIRSRTGILVSFGDCAVTANVPGLRNPIGPEPLLHRAYVENVTDDPGRPGPGVPRLLPRALPVHRVVDVDVFLPGCPPSADVIYETVLKLVGAAPHDGGGPPRFG